MLTLFLVWPLLLACVMVTFYWSNLASVGAYLLIILLTCATTAMLALFCSVVFRKTSTSLMTAYLVMILLFWVPLAVTLFTKTLARDRATVPRRKARPWCSNRRSSSGSTWPE